MKESSNYLKTAQDYLMDALYAIEDGRERESLRSIRAAMKNIRVYQKSLTGKNNEQYT